MTCAAPRSRRWLVAATLACLWAGGAAAALSPMVAQIELPSVSTPPRSRPAPVKVAQAPKPESTPPWSELKPAHKLALAPLAGTWSQLSEAHKRKWLAVAQNFPAMPPAEQARVHSRMADWAALSPQQRTQARLNFAETRKVPLDDKKAKWEAYQNLSVEEKNKLAAGAQKAKPAPPPTAAAVQPVAPQKLATVPKPKKNDPRSPRIAGAPSQVDHNTLLPQPGQQPAQP